MKPCRPRWLVRIWLLLTLVLLSGCFGTFRVHVPHAALDAADLEWEVAEFDEEGETLGVRVKETRYVHRTDDDRSPPFPGVLQVFSMRGSGSQDRDVLLDRARTVVDDAIAKEGIRVDADKNQDGARQLRSGVNTEWFLREGTIESGGGDFFDPESRITVRVLAEVGADGRSGTGFIVVAFVKVADHEEGLAPGLPATDVASDTTWFDVVADPHGSIGGATFSSKDRGLIYNLVTHD